MKNHTELIEALRHVGICQDCNECEAGRWYNEFDCCLFENAAAAFEALQARVDKQDAEITELLAVITKKDEEIEALQAAVERLKDSNEELREKQTYIDHYGAKWMTSAKDVPTAAYEHGYMDGRDEAMAKMEVQDDK